MTDLDRIMQRGLRQAVEHIDEPSEPDRARALETSSVAPPPAHRSRSLALAAAVLVLAAIGGAIVTIRGSADDPARVTTAPTAPRLADAGPGWHTLETESVPPMTSPALAWTGAELVVAGQSPAGFEVHAYRPDTEQWQRLPDPPSEIFDSVGMVWTGAEVVMVDGAFPASTAAAWSPTDQMWRDLGSPPAAQALVDAGSRGIRPNPTQPGPALVWTGERVLDLTHGAVWDPATRDWSALSLPDDVVAFTGLLYTNPVWDGTEVVAAAWTTQPGLAWNATGSTHRMLTPLPANIATPNYVVPAVATEFERRVLLVSSTDAGSVASLDARTGEWRREQGLDGMIRTNGCPRQAMSIDGRPVVQPCSGEAPVQLGADGWISTAPAPVGHSYSGTWTQADGVLVTWDSNWTDVPTPRLEANYWVPPSDVEPSPPEESSVACPDVPPEQPGGSGWYVPEGLPDGWTVDRAVAQAADSSGEAQLWLTTPAGNAVVVTLKVPRGGPLHLDDAVPHPLPGQELSVCAQAPSGELAAELRGAWPGAYLLANWLDAAPSAEVETSPRPFEVAELDAAVAALRPADTETWRAFLADVESVDQALLEPETLADLPDET